MKVFNNDRNSCYIAAGAFNDDQTRDRNAVRDILIKLQINYFSPLEEENCDANADDLTKEKVFENDIKSINTCTFMIASTTGKDMGTCFECGYAYSNNIPIIYYFPYNFPFNLMLAQSGYAVAKSEKELEDILIELKNNNFDFSNRKAFKGIIE